MGYNGGCGMQPGEVRIIPNRLSRNRLSRNRLSRTHAMAGCGGPKVTNHSSALVVLELRAGEGEFAKACKSSPSVVVFACHKSLTPEVKEFVV